MKKVRNILIATICIAVLFGVPALYIGNLNARSVTMTVGDSTKLKLSNPAMQMVAHFVSDDGSIVAAEEDGLIAAYNPGTTTVRVKTPFRTLKCKVFVLGFEKESTMMLEGQTVEPQVLGASGKAVFHSSDESVLQVTGGRIKTLKDGEATLICEDKGLTVSQNIKVAGIISDRDYLFTGNEMKMSINDEISGSPSNWSVDDTQVATIDENGVLKGVAAGSVVVSCQTGSGKILKTDVNIVGLKDANMFLLSGEDSGPPLISGKGFDADGMVWQSKDVQVASVDTSGNVKALGVGSTEVVGMLDGEEISGEIHVVEVPEKAFTAVGVSSKLQAADGQQEIVWASDDESKVKVEDGKLIGVSAGTSTITALAGNRTFSCEVSVGEVNTPSVTIDGTQTQKVEISGLDGQEAEWSCADTSVATVSESGEITPVGEGSTEVCCKIGTSTILIPLTVDNSELERIAAEEAAAKEAEEKAAAEAAEKAAAEKAAAEKAAAEKAAAEKAAAEKAAAEKAAAEEAAKKAKKSSSSKKSSKKVTNSEVKQPEEVTNNGGRLTGPEALVACGDYYNSVLLSCSANGEKWVYSNSSKYVAQTGTFENMLKGSIRGGNCGVIANWAFRDMGIIEKNQGFYGNSKGKIQHYNSGDTKVKANLDACCDVIKTDGKAFKTLMSEGNIKVGDVLLGKGHTFVYRGNGTVFASGHDAKWHKDTSVKTDDPNKAVFDNWVRSYKGTYDEKFKVQYIVRMKDSFVPKYYRDANGNLVKNQ